MVNKVENIITVINYIENNLTEKLNLSSIAMGVGYSKYHLHRMFVETVGLSYCISICLRLIKPLRRGQCKAWQFFHITIHKQC